METCSNSKCSALTWISGALVVIGAINWGLIGFFDFNLVTYLLGSWPLVETIVYDVVGVAGVIMLIGALFCKGHCGEEKM